MIPRLKVGKGVTGAVRYVLSEGKDRSGKYRETPKDETSRVAWISGLNLGFPVETAADADLARRVMEFDALNQGSKTKRCEKDCVHLSLGWRKGEQPTREQMEAAAHAALAALGMGNAKAIIVAHTDEPYAHLHIVASKINPATGRAYDLKGDRLKLSAWAQGYEEEHNGGIVCTRRAEANQLRAAIEARDAAAVLVLMTQQRATFKPADLERALAKQIKQPLQRAQFGNEVLALPEVVKLAEKPGDPVTRYTTRAILQAEGQVTLAARALHEGLNHRVPWATLTRIAERPEFRTMTREQRTAFARATQARGLALIDGQAGTGKSYTMSAIRQAYEADGYAVTGLAPTNAVAEDMRAGGFARADTIHAELFKLNNNRASPWAGRTVLMVDEAAMIDTQLMAQLMRRAEEAKAKVILVGDDRQLSSIDRGGMFGALKDEFGAAVLSEVRRQHKQDDRRAAELMAEGNFSAALAIYDDKKSIHWQHNQEAAREALVEQWTKDSAADPARSRFVFAYTNDDVDQLNADLRQVRQERGELGSGVRFETKHGPAEFADGDRLQLTGTDKKAGLINGAAGTVEGIDGQLITVKLDGRDGKTVTIDAERFQDFRHGYAGTIYKGQGRTLDETYLYHSEHWKASSGYVALTRHKDKTEIFVSRDVVEDLPKLARQMGRVDDRRAASHFHQPDGALAIERVPTAELPKITFPVREAAPPTGPVEQTAAATPGPRDWAQAPGMVAQQASALREAACAERAQVTAFGPVAPQEMQKPRVRVRADSSPVPAVPPVAAKTAEPVQPSAASRPTPTAAPQAALEAAQDARPGWADDAHGAAEYVEKLGQFVNAGAPDEAAQPRHTVIVAQRGLVSGAVGRRHVHASKLVDGKHLVAAPDTRLAEQHRARALQADRDSDQQQQRG